MTLDTNAPDNESIDSGSGISRRTVMRGAAITAWAVPAVTLVTAAPAFANTSPPIVVSAFTATYGASPVDPTKLTVSAKFTNGSAEATQNFKFTLSIPAGLYGTDSAPTPATFAPIATTPAGWGAPTITGSNALGWTLVFARTAQLAPGDSLKPFDTVITFRDRADSYADRPYARWVGSSWSLSGSATMNNGQTVPASVLIAATPDVPIKVVTWSVTSTGGIGNPKAYVKIVDLYNDGRSAMGTITIDVKVNKSGSGCFSRKPQATPGVIDTTRWKFISSDLSSGDAGPWYYKFETIGTAFAPSSTNGGPAADLDGPTSSPAFEADIYGNYKVGDVAVNASGAIKVSAPRAVTQPLGGF